MIYSAFRGITWL